MFPVSACLAVARRLQEGVLAPLLLCVIETNMRRLTGYLFNA